MMFIRLIESHIQQALARSPAVVLLGPRQIGKTTLAKRFKTEADPYLDLENPDDIARLGNVRAYLSAVQSHLLILDEVQHMPMIFKDLRGAVDTAREQGRKAGLYLLLGSASLDLIQKTSETLAGRMAFIELTGLHRLEVPAHLWNELWVRGGFPDSLLAISDADSAKWRQDFIRTYLQRDIPQFAPRVSAERLRRFWTMLAHLQGSQVNVRDLAQSLEVSSPTVNSYLDLLVDLLLVRRLQPWFANIGKRLTKSPKIYIRDSGLVHSLLGIHSMDALLGHPVQGASWEGHVIESLLAVIPQTVEATYYRSSGGAEIDLILSHPNGHTVAIEIKRSTAPKLSRGFFSACEDVKPTHKWVVHGGSGTFPMNDGVEALALEDAMRRVATEL